MNAGKTRGLYKTSNATTQNYQYLKSNADQNLRRPF